MSRITTRMLLPGIRGLLLLVTQVLWLTLPAQAQDIQITLDSFGIEGSFQPGGWVPVQVELTSALDDTASVLVSFEVKNNDGDTERYTREMVLSPGQPAKRWLYPHLPPTSSAQVMQSDVFTIRVHENDDGVPGRELASAPVSGASSRNVGTPIEMSSGILLVVGSNRMGLQEYMQNPIGNLSRVPSQNERTQIINTDVAQIPDRWQGLSMISTIVWGDASPKELGRNEARAILDWIKRGGRLVIMLPEAGDPWEFGSNVRNNYLLGIPDSADPGLMPSAGPERLDEVRISSLMQVLSKSYAIRNPEARISIRLFEDELDAPWEPLAALPRFNEITNQELGSIPEALNGAVYAIQRRLEHGWIAFVGIDADALHRRQLQDGGLPQADVFWNRLLARRGSIPNATAMNAYKEAKLLPTAPTSPYSLGMGALILDKIRIGGPSAGAAVMIAFLIFLIYWVLSGPGSYAILRHKKQIRHAWVVFVGIGLVFTVICLFAAGMGRRILQDTEPVRHITFLDIIDGEPQVRATTWFSAYLPGYGGSDIGVAGEKNILSTWSPPPTGTIERFPDSDLFQIRTDQPNRFVVPTRATSAHFVARWKGQLEGDWEDLPAAAEQDIRQILAAEDTNAFSVQGVIRHGLPWTLTDVDIICISPFRSRLPSYMAIQGISQETPLDALPNPGIYGRIGAWPTGEKIDLAAQFPGEFRNFGTSIAGDFGLTQQLNVIYNGVRSQVYNSISPVSAWNSMVPQTLRMYSYFDMLPQPVYLKDQPGTLKEGGRLHFNRWLGRETDCSDWFIRPCVLIIATIENAPLPVPIEIDGERPESSGTVILRWIHELPVDGRFVPSPIRSLKPFVMPGGAP